MKKKTLAGMLITCSVILAACGIKDNSKTAAKVTEAPVITQKIVVTQEPEATITPTEAPASVKKELPKATATPVPVYQPFDGDTSTYVYYYKDERNKAWEEDIIYIANKFVNRHPLLADIKYSGEVNWAEEAGLSDKRGAYNEESRKNFLQQINNLVLKVAELDDTEASYELQKIIASLKDGHSYVFPISKEAFPIYFVPLMSEGGYRLYVNIAPQDYEEIMFSYLESINGVSVKEIIESMSLYISADSKEWLIRQISDTRKSMAITHKDILRIIGIMKKEDTSAEFCFVAEDGTKQNIVMKVEEVLDKEKMVFCNMDLNPEVLMYQKKDNAYWYTKLEENHTLYIKMNKCQIDKTMPTADFIAQIVEEIKLLPKNGKLVFDFKNNTGGDANFMDFKPLLDEINRREDIKTYILLNKNAYSCGVVIPYLLKQEIENAILVGESAGQAPNTYGDPRTFYLPNSNIAISMANSYIEVAPEYAYDALLPDITIYQTLEDYKNGIDTVLEAVLAME